MKSEKLAHDAMIAAMQNPQTVASVRRANAELIARQRKAQAKVAKDRLEACSLYISEPNKKKPTLETLIIAVIISCIALAGKALFL